MVKFAKIYVISVSLLILTAASSVDEQAIMGFSTENSAEQRKLEADFDAGINSENLDVWMKRLTARPHYLGSPYNKDNAEWIAKQFKSWGYDTEIVKYHVLMPTPKLRSLELLSPTPYTASLEEAALEEDSTSGQIDERLPTYVAYSPDGDVTADVVFVNQGLKKDYEDLAARGIDVKGKIVLAKFGGSWRGIKPKLAEEMGAIGVIMYSDPEDDGYYLGDAYPKGAMKHATGAQRGSIMDLPMRPGDPLTPYVGATKDAKRLTLDEVEIFVSIPTLPISYTDALPILKALEGPVAPARWRGALPITYHMGPGPAKVRLQVAFNWDIVPLYNVIAKLKGSTYPDEWVMRGNHHDAWVHGAADPISGLVSTMEEARMVAKLAKEGMAPKRTIIYAAWDGEEQGLIGSVEWIEDNAAELKSKLVAYINTDGTGRGFLSAGGSHTLELMMSEVANELNDPLHNISLHDRRMALRKSRGDEKAFKDSRFHLSALGSGSDYSGFFQHLGVPALNISFSSEIYSGSYHTNYDSYDHFTRFKDIDFMYGKLLTQVTGRTTLRLANADLLPFEFSRFAEAVDGYVSEVKKLADTLRKDNKRHNEMISSGSYRAASDIKKAFSEPAAKPILPFLNFSPIENAMTELKAASKDFSTILIAVQKENYQGDIALMRKTNALIKSAEQYLTHPEGLPRRPWFRHHIYAPGFYTGYGVKTLPGVREGIEEYKPEEAQMQIDKLATLLHKYSDNIKHATDTLKLATAK